MLNAIHYILLGIISNIGQDFSFLREIKYLQESKSCIHIVNILDVYIVNSSINLVLEYCDFDLEKVIKDKNILLHASHIKCYMQMLLQGLQFLHSKFILHRDLKPANLLLNDRGIHYKININIFNYNPIIFI